MTLRLLIFTISSLSDPTVITVLRLRLPLFDPDLSVLAMSLP
jgi:hypothetical protein